MEKIALLLVLESIYVYICTASYVHTLYQDVSLIPEHERTRHAREAKDLKYCGSRINPTNFSTELLVAKDWCDVGSREPGYIYMLKEEVITTQVKSWGFSSYIPVCADIGSSFEMQLTPQSGWTSLAVKLFKADWSTTVHLVFDPLSGPLVEGMTSSIIIIVQADSFQSYVDGIEYENVPYILGVAHYPMYLQIHPAPADIHKIIYKAAPTP